MTILTLELVVRVTDKLTDGLAGWLVCLSHCPRLLKVRGMRMDELFQRIVVQLWNLQKVSACVILGRCCWWNVGVWVEWNSGLVRGRRDGERWIRCCNIYIYQTYNPHEM